MKKDVISIVVPCYNEEQAIPFFYEEILNLKKQMKYVNFEIIFVDDGSKDGTLNLIKNFEYKDKTIKYISFSRNFGKEAAMYAGLKKAIGDYVTVMDVDLQDPISLLPVMYKYIKNDDFDVIGTRRVTRKGEPVIRSFFARMFYKLINKMSNIEMVDGARDYRLMTRQVVNSILLLNEYNRYSKGIFSYVGYKTKWIEYENKERIAGETKWSFWKLFKYAIEAIVSFSTIPLTIIALFGIIICLISFLAIIFIIIKTLIYGDPVGGWPSMVCIILFVSGIQLLCMGVIGQYLSKMYLEIKNRPIYIVKEEK